MTPITPHRVVYLLAGGAWTYYHCQSALDLFDHIADMIVRGTMPSMVQFWQPDASRPLASFAPQADANDLDSVDEECGRFWAATHKFESQERES